MNTALAGSMLAAAAIPLLAAAADKPRIFVTESQTLQLSGDAAAGEAKGSLSISGGASPQNVEVMKAFMKRCPEVVVTSNPDKADYVVRLDHEETSPATPFIRGNKVAIFDRNEDLIYSDSTRLLRNAVTNACAALATHSRNKAPARAEDSSGSSDVAQSR